MKKTNMLKLSRMALCKRKCSKRTKRSQNLTWSWLRRMKRTKRLVLKSKFKKKKSNNWRFRMRIFHERFPFTNVTNCTSTHTPRRWSSCTRTLNMTRNSIPSSWPIAISRCSSSRTVSSKIPLRSPKWKSKMSRSRSLRLPIQRELILKTFWSYLIFSELLLSALLSSDWMSIHYWKSKKMIVLNPTLNSFLRSNIISAYLKEVLTLRIADQTCHNRVLDYKRQF